MGALGGREEPEHGDEVVAELLAPRSDHELITVENHLDRRERWMLRVCEVEEPHGTERNPVCLRGVAIGAGQGQAVRQQQEQHVGALAARQSHPAPRHRVNQRGRSDQVAERADCGTNPRVSPVEAGIQRLGQRQHVDLLHRRRTHNRCRFLTTRLRRT